MVGTTQPGAVGQVRAQADRAVRQGARAGVGVGEQHGRVGATGARAARAPAPRRRRMLGLVALQGQGGQRHEGRQAHDLARPRPPARGRRPARPPPPATARPRGSAPRPPPRRHLRGPVGEPIGHVAPHGRQPRVAGARRDRRGALRRSDDGDRAARGLGREPRHGGEPAAGRDGLDHARVQVAEGRPGRGIVRRGGGSQQGHATAEGASRPFARGQDRACARLAFAMLPPVTRDFTWRDGERIVRFGRGALADAPDLLGDGYVLLTTPRAAAVGARPSSPAPRPSTTCRPGASTRSPATCASAVDGELFVALGGGRVVDVAKALAAAHRGAAARHPDDAERRRDDPRAPPRPRRRPGHAARAPADRAQRPGAERLAARGRPGGVGRQRARPRDRGPADAARLARAGARRPRGGAPARPRGRPRRARPRRAAGGLRHRLHRLRPAPRARPDARALRRRVARARERGDAAAHDRRPAPARARGAGRARRRGRRRDGGAGAAAGRSRGRPAAARPRGHRGRRWRRASTRS